MSDDAQVWRALVQFKTPEPLTDDQREGLVLKFGDRPDNFTTMLDNEETREVSIEFDVRAETNAEAVIRAGASFSRCAYQVLPEVRDVQIDVERVSDILAREAEEVERLSENGLDA